MPKSVHTPKYRHLRELLIQKRKAAARPQQHGRTMEPARKLNESFAGELGMDGMLRPGVGLGCLQPMMPFCPWVKQGAFLWHETQYTELQRHMADLTGRWIGRIEGTNAGNFLLDVVQQGTSITGQARLNDARYGITVFDVAGDSANDQVALRLEPKEALPGVQVTRGKVVGTVEQDGSLRGHWEMDGGTAGMFLAVREQKVQEGLNSFDQLAASATAVSYEKTTRIPACVIDYDTLRQLHREMVTGATEAFRIALASSGTTVDQKALRLTYSVTILARGANGEQVLTIDADVLRQESLPRPLQSIRFEIGLYYTLMNKGVAPPNRGFVILDFSKPRAIDFSNASGAPTPNNSLVSVVGNDSIWAAGVYQRLLSTIEQGKTGVQWLHSAYVYDILLFTFGLPFSLAFAAIMSHHLAIRLALAPAIYSVAVFVFLFAAGIMVFRLAFSWTRWLLPYVEFAPQKQPLERRIKTIIAVITLGALGSLAAWAILKALNAG